MAALEIYIFFVDTHSGRGEILDIASWVFFVEEARILRG